MQVRYELRMERGLARQWSELELEAALAQFEESKADFPDSLIELERIETHTIMSSQPTKEIPMSESSLAMPKYKCHKEVFALKITAIDGVTLTVEEKGFTPFPVSEHWMIKHNPQPGGYYVVYKDGYKSFSPAEAFEDGYTRV